MNNYKKINIVLSISWMVVFLAVLIIVLQPKIVANRDDDLSATTVEDTQVFSTQPRQAPIPTVQQEEITLLDEQEQSTTNMDITGIAGNYWYLFDDQEKTCYVFCFGEKSRVDLAFFDSSNLAGNSEYVTGYSTFHQLGDKLLMSYLPDAFPTKDFELTVKDNALYLNNQKLESHNDLSLKYFINRKDR